MNLHVVQELYHVLLSISIIGFTIYFVISRLGRTRAIRIAHAERVT